MKYIVNKSHNPFYNIALEAYAFRELRDEDELFILWINEPTIVIGKHQNAIEEINKAYTDEHGIHAVSYTHLTLPTNSGMCRSRWSPYH